MTDSLEKAIETGEIDPDGGLELVVQQAAGGDHRAFNRLVERFHEQLFKMVYYRIRSRIDAEDITQDVFLQAFRQLARLKDTSRFKSWLFTIGVNRVRDFQRKWRFRNLFRLEDNPGDNAEAADRAAQERGALNGLMRQDFWKQVDGILSRLPRMQKEVFLLRFFDHLSLREIADVLGKSESTVKTHLYRALVKFRQRTDLRQMLQENDP